MGPVSVLQSDKSTRDLFYNSVSIVDTTELHT